MPVDAIQPLGIASDWVRTSRGSRPATADQRTAAVVRRILQRAQITGKELRALHAALRQVEMQVNGGQYFNG
jgi:tRNA C32,U32 (ribose-2'-O)-methylase TrmJ